MNIRIPNRAPEDRLVGLIKEQVGADTTVKIKGRYAEKAGRYGELLTLIDKKYYLIEYPPVGVKYLTIKEVEIKEYRHISFFSSCFKAYFYKEGGAS